MTRRRGRTVDGVILLKNVRAQLLVFAEDARVCAVLVHLEPARIVVQDGGRFTWHLGIGKANAARAVDDHAVWEVGVLDRDDLRVVELGQGGLAQCVRARRRRENLADVCGFPRLLLGPYEDNHRRDKGGQQTEQQEDDHVQDLDLPIDLIAAAAAIVPAALACTLPHARRFCADRFGSSGAAPLQKPRTEGGAVGAAPPKRCNPGPPHLPLSVLAR
jgi:hypothetical protein